MIARLAFYGNQIIWPQGMIDAPVDELLAFDEEIIKILEIEAKRRPFG